MPGLAQFVGFPRAGPANAAPSTTTRRTALAVVFLAQIAMFAVLLPRPLQVAPWDNFRYEVAGYNLARGEGLTLPYSMQEDPDVRDWACSRHPSWCVDDRVPAAIFPPGYQVYIAAVYAAAGRSLAVLFLSHLALLLSMFFVFEKMAAACLGRAGYFFVMAVAATYPFLAHQAGRVMSDHLHAALLLFALALLMLRPPSWSRGLVGGLLLGAATLTRPYSFVCLPVVALAIVLLKPRRDGWLTDLVAWSFGVALPFVVWIVRNEIVFGRFLPFTTSGLGVSLYYDKLEWTIGSTFDPIKFQATVDEIGRQAGGETLSWRANHVLSAAAFAWMRENPWKVAAALPLRVVRLWISLGNSGQGVSRAWPLLVSYLGGLLLLGVVGMWIGRHRREVLLVASFVVPYWLFLLHTPAEARRTLPLRLPMLLCAGVAMDAFLGSTYGRRVLRSLRARLVPRKALLE